MSAVLPSPVARSGSTPSSSSRPAMAVRSLSARASDQASPPPEGAAMADALTNSPKASAGSNERRHPAADCPACPFAALDVKRAAVSGLGCGRSARCGCLVPGRSAVFDLFVPDVVVLLGETLVDLAAHHALQHALDTKGAQVDVPERDGDQEQPAAGMHDVRELHGAALPAEVREQQVEARDGQRNTAEEQQPEEYLLTGIGEARRRMAFAEEPAGGFHPREIVAPEDVLGNPDDQHHDESRDKWQREIVVDRFRNLGPGGEAFLTHERNEHGAAEDQTEAGDGEQHEQDGDVPVQSALEGRPAFHLPPGLLLQLLLAEHDVFGSQGDERRDDQRAAQESDGTVAYLLPVLTAVLDQHPGFRTRNRRVAVRALAHRAPVFRTRVRRLGIGLRRLSERETGVVDDVADQG